MEGGSTSPAEKGAPTVADQYTVSAGNGDFVALYSQIFGEINDELDAELKAAVRSGAQTARTFLRGNSPKQSGDYARDWACDYSDRDGHHEAVVKNRHHYQLTHLLEDGHKSKNQYGGPYGHVGPAKPKHHIEQASKRGEEAINKKLGV